MTKVFEQIKAVHAAKKQLQEELSREPLVEEIAAQAGVEISEAKELLYLTVEEEKEDDFQLRFKLTIKNHEMEKARLAKNMRQQDLADLTSIGMATISQIESCRTYPFPERQKIIAKALGANPAILFPIWLLTFSRKWNESEKSRIVPISQISLAAPEVRLLPSGDYENMIRVAESSIIRKQIEELSSELSPKEQSVLNRRFGFNGEVPQTYEEVGKEIGVTRERVRQIEAKILERIRPHIKL